MCDNLDEKGNKLISGISVFGWWAIELECCARTGEMPGDFAMFMKEFDELWHMRNKAN
jgi:hypothetical protein